MQEKATITIEAKDLATSEIEKAKKSLDLLASSAEEASEKTSQAQKAWEEAGESLDKLSETFGGLDENLKRQGDRLLGTAQEIGSNFGRNLCNSVALSTSPIPAMMAGLGANSAKMFAQGLLSGLSEVESAASSIASVISDFLELHSPARLGPLSKEDPTNWTKRLAKMLEQGLLSGEDFLRGSSERVAQALFDGFSSLPSRLAGIAEGITSSCSVLRSAPQGEKFGGLFTDGLNTSIDDIKENLSRAASSYRNASEFDAMFSVLTTSLGGGGKQGAFPAWATKYLSRSGQVTDAEISELDSKWRDYGWFGEGTALPETREEWEKARQKEGLQGPPLDPFGAGELGAKNMLDWLWEGKSGQRNWDLSLKKPWFAMLNYIKYLSGFKKSDSYQVPDDLKDTGFGKLLEGSSADVSGLPSNIVGNDLFKALAPKMTLADLEKLYWGSPIGLGLTQGPVGQADKLLPIREFLAKYNGKINNSALDRAQKELGIGFDYNLGFLKEILFDQNGSPNTTIDPVSEGSSRLKSAYEIGQRLYGMLSNAEGTSAWQYDVSGKNAYLKELFDSLGIKKDGKTWSQMAPREGEGLWGGANLEQVNLVNSLVSSGSSFEDAVSEAANELFRQAVSARQEELGKGKANPALYGGWAGTDYWKLVDPAWIATHGSEASTLTTKYLDDVVLSKLFYQTGNIDLTSTLGEGKPWQPDSGYGVGMQTGAGKIEINQTFNLDLGGYEGDISSLAREIAQQTVIEAQKALLELVNFRG